MNLFSFNRHRALACAIALPILAGCRLSVTTPDAGAMPAPVEVRQLPGLSTLQVELAAPTLPEGASIMVTAHSPTKLKEPRLTVLTAEELSRKRAAGEPILDFLPATKDMAIRAYMRGPDESLLASGERTNVHFGRGDNVISVSMTPRLEPPKVLGASDGVDASDGIVIKGVALDLSTGLMDAMPGIDRVDIAITGSAYGDGRETAKLASFPAPNIRQYSWRPANASADYLPNRLDGDAQGRPFTLVAQAIDPFGNVAGKTRLPLSIVNTAFVEVGFGH